MGPVFFTTQRPQWAAAAVYGKPWLVSPLKARACSRTEAFRQVICMAHPRRVVKVAKQIEREIGNLLIHDKVMQQAICPERRSGFDSYLSAVASVTEVQLTNDLQVAKVYVSVYSDDMGKAVAMQSLHRLEGYVRKHIGRTVRLRLTPEIRFIMDDSIERSERVAQLLKQMEQIRLGEAEPPPIAIPDDFSDDEDDFFEDDEGSDRAAGPQIGTVDLGFFGGGDGARRPRSRPGRQLRQQQPRAAARAAQGARDGRVLPPPAADEKGFFVDEGEEGEEEEELSEQEVEEMLRHFKQQRAAEEARRRGA